MSRLVRLERVLRPVARSMKDTKTDNIQIVRSREEMHLQDDAHQEQLTTIGLSAKYAESPSSFILAGFQDDYGLQL